VLLHLGSGDSAVSTNLDDTQPAVIVHDGGYARYVELGPARGRPASVDIRDASDADEAVQRYDAKPTDLWAVLFSSGTTGVSKGIERDHYSIVTELVGWCLELGLTRHTVFYIGRPVFYTGGLVLSLATLLVGGSLVLCDYKDDNNADEVWEDFQLWCHKAAVEWAFFVPDQIRAFITPRRSRPGLSRPQGVLAMGAPISGDEKQALAELLKCDVVESWGNSESLGTITDPEDLQLRPNSVGRPFLTDEMSIIDDEGALLAPGCVGRIAGSQEAGFSKYSNRPEATGKARRGDLLVSDDFGYMDSDGYLYVVAREQETVIIDGHTVVLSDLEKRIRGSGAVKDVCIVAIKRNSGLELTAIIVPLAEACALTTAQLNQTIGTGVAITRVVALTSLPRVPSGKTDRSACCALAEKPNETGLDGASATGH
jgi:acyl-coenzyme A synthetase/AMP-(fatty) acid ligase